METQTESTKTCDSDAAALARTTLEKLGVQGVGRMTDTQAIESLRRRREKLESDEAAIDRRAGELQKAAAPDPDAIRRREQDDAYVRRHNAERELAEAARLRKEAFDRSGCPLRAKIDLAIPRPSNPKWDAIRDLLVAQAGSHCGFLVALLGQSGTGKTQLAVSVIRECCGHGGATARYVKAIDLFRDLRRAYSAPAKGESADAEDEIVRTWTGYDLLVIDECHQRGRTDWEANSLINLLDRRYDEMNATILIANQDKEGFANEMGPSVVSRMHETGEAIVCDWPSFRKIGQWKQNRNGQPA